MTGDGLADRPRRPSSAWRIRAEISCAVYFSPSISGIQSGAHVALDGEMVRSTLT